MFGKSFNFGKNICYYIVIFLIVILCLKIYRESDVFNLKCIIAGKDGNRYCVRETDKMEESANMLAEVTERCKLLVRKLKVKYPDRKDIDKLHKDFNPQRITETLPTSELTAYSENKGEKIAFCLNKKKHGSQLIDIDTLTFVAIHELSHVMTTSIGHKQEFWENFKFLLTNAKEFKIHDPVDYKKNPEEYCSQEINSNPYFDL
jgi:hypothetical protein